MNLEMTELMRDYFINKDKSKQIKLERQNYSESNKCEGQFDCIASQSSDEDFCEVCKRRHQFYLKIQKLGHKNSGIIKRARNLIEASL